MGRIRKKFALCVAVIAAFALVLGLGAQSTKAAVKKGKAGSITYEAHDTGKGVVMILKNTGSKLLIVSAKVVYYDKKKMIGTSSDTNYAFHGKKQCAMYFYPPHDSSYQNVKYTSYKVSITAEAATYTKSVVPNITVTADKGADNVTAKITNKSKDNLYSVKVAIVWYKGNTVIGQETRYAECTKKGSTDYITFDFPYDSNYQTITPGKYKIFVNSAYLYTW